MGNQRDLMLSGSITHFDTFSGFFSFIGFAIIGSQYYVLSNNKLIKLLVFLFLTFFALLMGDKSTFMVIFFIYF